MFKHSLSAIRKAFLLIFCLTIILSVPSDIVHAAENRPVDSSVITMPSIEETEFLEGAHILTGSSFDISDNPPVEPSNYASKKLKSGRSGGLGYSLYELGGNEYGYYSLSDNQMLLFDAIGEYLEGFIDSELYKTDLTSKTGRLEVRIDYLSKYDLSDDDIAETMCRFVYSNPQYYWIGLSYSYASDEDYVAAVINVDPYYYRYSARKAADDAIEAKTSAWVAEVIEAASEGEFFGALKAHDIIIGAIDYAYNASGQPEQAMWAHSIAGVFTGQGAVCEGYAKCFEYLLDLAGIPNIYILGTGAKEAHAWNAIEIMNQWYLCDITWDDPGSSGSSGLIDSNYSYFCIPASKFDRKHKAWGNKDYYGYELPEFEDTMEQSFFTVFDCYSDEAFTEATGESFAASMLGSRYRDIDYVFAAFPANAKNSFLTYVVPYLTDLDAETDITMTDTAIGTVAKYASPITEGHADSISPEMEDFGDEDGSGADTAEAVIWQNGTKENKSTTIDTKLTASTWQDSKGKVKSGKLVWFVSDKHITPSFISIKHTVSFRAAKSKCASVNAKGIVTAKKAGTVYVYICDTGSLTYEEHVIRVAAAPTKLFVTSVPNSTQKDVVLKKVAADAGTTYRAYITPFIKNGKVDTGCTYTVRAAKAGQEKYVSVGEAVTDADGNVCFNFTALDFDQAKGKTVSVKIEAVCDQTGKKTGFTVVIGNPVLDATCVDPDADNADTEPVKLSKKGNSVTLKLFLTTALDNTNITTDKIKIYVGLSDVSFNDHDKVEAERGATIKAKFDKKTMLLTLTASKDAAKTALITAAFTDVLTKEITLIDLAEVDENGELKIW